MNIIGIDPGTIKTGIVHITGKGDPHFSVELIGYESKGQEKLPVLNDRLAYIVPGIAKRLKEAAPELVMVEYPFGISGHAKAVVELFGIIRWHCIMNGFKIMPLQSAKIKKYATGHGRAEKSDLRMQVYKEYGLDLSEDKADAFWIGHFGMSLLYPETITKAYRKESIEAMTKPKPKKKKKEQEAA